MARVYMHGRIYFMERRDNNLAFAVSEASDLNTIFAAYVPRYEQEVSTDEERVRQLWAMTSDISIGSLTYKLTQITEREALEEKLAAHMPWKPTLEVGKLTTILFADEFVVEDGVSTLEPIIEWASREFIVGSLVMQNEVGRRLNSDFEDIPTSQAVGSTNKSYADHASQGMLLIGMQAEVWLEEIRRKANPTLL